MGMDWLSMVELLCDFKEEINEMFFFLNDSIQVNKSGIEFAQIKRLQLFKQNHESAMIVTRKFNNLLHDVTKTSGIDDEDFVNMYDYFQNARLVPTKKVTIQDLDIPTSLERKTDQNNKSNYIYYKDGHQLLYVARHNNKDKAIINVQYFDHYGKLLKINWYDARGFMTAQYLYDWKGKIATENYYTPAGKLAMQVSRLTNKAGAEIENYHLFNYKGHDYQFTGMDSIYSFFLDQLVTDPAICGDEQVGLIVDRNFELAWSVMHMKNRVPRYMQLHSTHVNNAADVMNSAYNFNYTWGFDHLKDWDGIIALTPQQQDDVKLRLGKYGVPIFRVPSAVVSDEVMNAPHVLFENRKKDKVVVVARLSPEKQQAHLIAAWPQILEKVPDATLDLWGYANDDYDKKLKKQVKELKLEKSVNFKGFTSNIALVDDQAQLMVLPTSAEGLAIALVEAESHGLPMVANDVKYGPSDIIIDGRDGILTKNGDIDGLAKAVISLLTDQKKLAEMSKNAYEDSARYSGPEVMKLWQKIIDDAESKGAKE